MNKPKAQGTYEETWIVNALCDRGFDAERIAEGGRNDLGDIRIEDWNSLTDTDFIIESKARQALGIHAAVAKANRKSGSLRSVVVWKRLVKPSGGGRRVPVDGMARIVAMDFDTFMWLLEQGAR